MHSKEIGSLDGRRLETFLSVVVVVRNRESDIATVIGDIQGLTGALVRTFELVVVDNASSDRTAAILEDLAKQSLCPGLQVYCLATKADDDSATWAGVSNALGDFVLVVDPWVDDIAFLPTMVEAGVGGAQAVFATNLAKPATSPLYRLLSRWFVRLFGLVSGVDLRSQAPRYRLLSKDAVSLLHQHRHPALAYRLLPAVARISCKYLSYRSLRTLKKPSLGTQIQLSVKLLVSSTTAPMRIATLLCTFGALANVIYTVYVIVVASVKSNVAPGWITLSLQQSGMFFLISLVLLILAEYVLHAVNVVSDLPDYQIGAEFTSAKKIVHETLNVEGAVHGEGIDAVGSVTPNRKAG